MKSIQFDYGTNQLTISSTLNAYRGQQNRCDCWIKTKPDDFIKFKGLPAQIAQDLIDIKSIQIVQFDYENNLLTVHGENSKYECYVKY